MIISPDNTQYHASSAVELSTFCLLPVQMPSKIGGIMFFGDDQ